MTLEEFDESLPGHLRVKPDLVPPEVRDAAEYAATGDAMRDAGMSEDMIPTYAEWAHRG